MDDVMNLTYTFEGNEYTLVDGVYAQPAAPGSATMDTVTIHEPWVAFGDLNGDNIEDAAPVLYHAPGGSGVFRYLAAVVATSEGPVNQATESLGDRVRINTMGITDGEISMEVITHGEDDPMCCPTEIRRWAYRLEGDKLVQTADELLGAVEGDQSGTPPTVTISVYPSKALIGDKVDIYTHAFDSPGVTKLELYHNDEKTEQEWTSPEPEGVPYLHYTFVYRDAEEGNHEFKVKAIDTDGNEGWSDVKIVKVRESWDEGEAAGDDG
jgi:hypothetical protein